MKIKLTPILSAMALTVASQTATAIDIGEGNGKLEASVKAMHILGSNENTLDPNSGTGYLATIRYESPKVNDIKLGLGLYNSGDLFGMTDFEATKPAKGMFVTDVDDLDTAGDPVTQLGEAYLDWKPEQYHVYGGRMIYKTPLTQAPTSLMPTFFTVFGASTTALSPGLEIGLARATQMSLGARTRTEWGVIGEGTGTAGTGTNPVTSNPATSLGQADFHSISKATLGANADDTDGMSVFNIEYNGIKNLKLSLWDYYVHDIANNIYLEAEKTIPLQGKKVKLSGQYLTQSAIGDELYVNKSKSDTGEDLDFNMYGLKASIGNKKWGAFAAYNNSSGDTKMLNAWGGDPAYTSSIFSRNAYRENVAAYKMGGHYKFAKGWMVKASLANYGQSDTTRGTSTTVAQEDATEADIMLVWKPMKGATMKLFHANRVSEYNGAGASDIDLTMGHTRFIAEYTF